jgi:nitroreductase
MYDLEQAINERRSIRMFLPDKPVPREMVDQALELAIRAPSNSNVQPWHLHLVSGAARDRLVAAMLDEATSKAPRVPELPERFMHLRRELGAQVYGPWA